MTKPAVISTVRWEQPSSLIPQAAHLIPLTSLLALPTLAAPNIPPSLQLGDGAREMAVTQWLEVFEGIDLVVPGFASASKDSGSFLSRYAVSHRPASARSLATHLLLLRIVIQGLGGVLYVSVRKQGALRLLLLIGVASVAAVSGIVVLCSRGRAEAPNGSGCAQDGADAPNGSGGSPSCFHTVAPNGSGGSPEGAPITASPSSGSMLRLLRTRWPNRGGGGSGGGSDGDCDGDIDGRGANGGSAAVDKGGAELVLPIGQFSRWEVSLTFFIVASRFIPQQASDTVLAYFSSSSAVVDTLADAVDGGQPDTAQAIEGLLAPIGSLIWLITLVYLGHQIYQLPRECPSLPQTADLHAPPPLPPVILDGLELTDTDTAAFSMPALLSDAVPSRLARPSAALRGDGSSSSQTLSVAAAHAPVAHASVDEAARSKLGRPARSKLGRPIEAARSKLGRPSPVDEAARSKLGRPSPFSTWMCFLWTINGVLASSGLLLAVPAWLGADAVATSARAAMTVVAIVAFVPYLPLTRGLDIHVDAFLIGYGHERAPSIVYYSNIANVLVAWPMLAIKWIVVAEVRPAHDDASGCGAASASTVARDNTELGLTVVVTSALLMLACLYYSLLDRLLPAHASLRAALRPPDNGARLQAHQRAAAPAARGRAAAHVQSVPVYIVCRAQDQEVLVSYRFQ